jgi:hypothetical protein
MSADFCGLSGSCPGLATFFFRDFGLFSYPLAYYFKECFWRGELPLWNPLNNCGVPFLAQWNTMVLYPGSLFYLLLPLSWSLAVFCLLHQFWAGLGMFYLARRWTGNGWAAGVAGLLFAFNGMTLNSLMWPAHVATLGWTPWVVLAVERAWREGSGWLVGAVLAGTLQLLAGSPEMAGFTWMILGGLFLGQLLLPGNQTASRARMTGRLILLMGLIGGLTAVQWAPFLDLVWHSERGAGYSDGTWSMPGLGWANFLVPMFRGGITAAGVFYPYGQAWTSSYYLSMAGLVLAGVALWRVRNPRVGLLAMLTAAGILLAEGDQGLVYAAIKQALPAIGSLRFPVKFVTLAVCCVPLLAAYGFQWLLARPDPPSNLRLSTVVIMGLGVCLGLGVVVAIAYELGIVATLAVGCRARAMSAVRTKALSAALLALIWADLMTHMPRQNPTIPRAAYEPGLVTLVPQPVHGQSRAMVSPRAFAAILMIMKPKPLDDFLGKRFGLFTDCNLLEGIAKVDGFFPLNLRETEQVCRLFRIPGQGSLEGLSDFLGISHITAPGTLIDWSVRTNSLPLITAGQQPEYLDGKALLRALMSPGFNPRQQAYLVPEAKGRIQSRATAAARVYPGLCTAHRVQAEVESPTRTLVVIAQAYYHPWHAYLDGHPIPLWRANHAFQAVESPPGRHRLELVYEDAVFRMGMMLTVITAVGMMGWQVFLRFTGRVHQKGI